MSDEQGGRDSGEKVVRLFPEQSGESRGGLERGSPFDWQDASVLEREIRGVLEEARPEAAGEVVTRPGPDPSHRNAVQCPQCDAFTWRRTQFCKHCGADLAVYAAERRQAILWCAAVASWGVACGCIYVQRHYALPHTLQLVLRFVSLGIIGINLIVFWFLSQIARTSP